jgi:hypothetical protein
LLAAHANRMTSAALAAVVAAPATCSQTTSISAVVRSRNMSRAPLAARSFKETMATRSAGRSRKGSGTARSPGPCNEPRYSTTVEASIPKRPAMRRHRASSPRDVLAGSRRINSAPSTQSEAAASSAADPSTAPRSVNKSSASSSQGRRARTGHASHQDRRVVTTSPSRAGPSCVSTASARSLSEYSRSSIPTRIRFRESRHQESNFPLRVSKRTQMRILFRGARRFANTRTGS